MTLTYTVRPISDRTPFAGKPAPGTRRPFSATWPSTLQLLERELAFLSRAHPDRNNGDRSRWNAVDEAEQVLRRAGRLG